MVCIEVSLLLLVHFYYPCWWQGTMEGYVGLLDLDLD